MTQNSRRQQVMIYASFFSLFVLVMQAGLMARNLGTALNGSLAVSGQQGTQPEGAFLNLINWIGSVIAPVGAGGTALMAIPTPGAYAARGADSTPVGLLGNRTSHDVSRHPTAGVLDCPRHWWSYLDPLSAGATGGPAAPANFSGTNDYGPSSTNAGLHAVMQQLPPSAAIICLVLAGLSLRPGSIPDALVGGLHDDGCSITGDHVVPSLCAQTHQLVPVVRSACASAERHHLYGLDGQPPD